MIRKIKGLLGFCQCDKCWNRTYATINIKAINRKIDVCQNHMETAMVIYHKKILLHHEE